MAGAFALEAYPTDARTVAQDHTAPSITIATAGEESPQQTQGTEVQGQPEEPDDVTLTPALNMVRAVVVLTRALVM